MTQLTDNTWYTSDHISPLQLFIRLTRGQLQPGKFWRKASFRRKFLIRSLVMPRANQPITDQSHPMAGVKYVTCSSAAFAYSATSSLYGCKY